MTSTTADGTATRTRRRGVMAVATAMLAAVALSGCTLITTIAEVQNARGGGGGTTPGDVPSDVVDADLDDALRAYYEQDLDWSACDGFECAMATVPIDWNDPSKGEAEIAMLKVAATGTPQGSLLLNPGGPGGSGVEYATYASYLFGADVLRNYDIIGFDPRGVGDSTPVKCLDDEEMDEWLYPTPDPSVENLTDDEIIEIWEQSAREFGEKCLEKTGPLLEFVDSISVVHDMDMMRAVLGDVQLNFIGFSYGTELAAQYIDLFPERVGRIVLDGAVDPTVPYYDMVLQQSSGFTDATRAYIEDCLSSSSCPLTGTYDDAIDQIIEMMNKVDTDLPKHSDGRTATSAVLDLAITQAMYAESLWPDLTSAFTMYVDSGDVSGFFALADYYNGRNPDGTYQDNSNEAFIAINCLRYPVETDVQKIIEFNQEYAKGDPFASSSEGFEEVGNLTCENWPFQSRVEVGPVEGKGAAPVIVVSTTGDPATPYEWGVSLADQLESATLLTYEGEGHTAYGSVPCVNDIIDEYFVDGVVPDGSPVC